MENQVVEKQKQAEKFRFLSSRLKQLVIVLVVAAAGILFLPLWLLNILSSSKSKPRSTGGGDLSLFNEHGMLAILIAVGGIFFLTGLMAWLSGWFKLYRKRNEY